MGTVYFYTADESGAGTDLDVQICFFREMGSRIPLTDWLTLDNSGDDRERGKVDIYSISNMPSVIGDACLRVKHEPGHINDNVMYDAWYLQWVVVQPSSNDSNTLFYHYNNWIKIPQGDPNWHVIENLNYIGTASNEALSRLGKLALSQLPFQLPGNLADAICS